MRLTSALLAIAAAAAVPRADAASYRHRRMMTRQPPSGEQSHAEALRLLCESGWQSAVCKDPAMMAAVIAEYEKAGATTPSVATPEVQVPQVPERTAEANGTISQVPSREATEPEFSTASQIPSVARAVEGEPLSTFLVPAAAAATLFVTALLLRRDARETLPRTGSRLSRLRRRSVDDERRPLLPS